MDMDFNLGVLIARLVFGLSLSAHGAQKLFGWFGGYGIAGTGQFLESVGFRPGRLMAVAAGLSETVGGLLLALGFLGPIGPALMLAVMITASSMHWKNGFFFTSNGIEATVLYGASAVALAFVGYGAYSLDVAFGLTELWTPGLAWAAIALGAVGGIANLVVRSASTHATVSA
jgi:putative oxidoreductase